jgi:transposase-like protein
VETERKIWQNRSLDAVYPIIFFDAIVVKVRQDGRVINKAIHLALGVNMAGQKELLGLWITQNESSKFWLNVLTELQNRGLKDIFIACCDGLTGFPEAIETVFPKTQVQLCMIIPFFAFPPDIRKAIYTTNAIESVNMCLRKVLRNHRSFPTDESAMKVIYLAIHNISKKWTMPIRDWKSALTRFSIPSASCFPKRCPSSPHPPKHPRLFHLKDDVFVDLFDRES